MWGLNTDPSTDGSYSSIDYAFYFDAGVVRIYESNASVYNGGGYANTDIFSIVYDGANVRYYQNSTLVKTTARAIGTALYFDSSFYETGSSIVNVGFGPSGEQGLAGASGAGISAGSANQVIYKDGGNAFAGSANLTFDGTSLNIGGSTSGGALKFNSDINWDQRETTQAGAQLLSYGVIRATGRKNTNYPDENFQSGNNGIAVYDNAGSGQVTVTRIAAPTGTPTTSGFVMQVNHTGTGQSPNFGGFYFAVGTRANAVIACVFKAKIPAGYTLNFHSNSIGTNGTSYWATNNVGTGKWEQYIYVVMCGDSGTLSSTHFFALSGSPNPSGAAPVTWFICSAAIYDMADQRTDYLQLDRTTGLPNIKGYGEGQIIIDGSTTGKGVYLNHYINGDVYVASGGGKTRVGGSSAPTYSLDVTGAGAVQDYFRITNTGGAQRLLMGNQDSSGVNNPSVIQAANGTLFFGNGNTWGTNGGTVTNFATWAPAGSTLNGSGNGTPALTINTTGSGNWSEGIRINPGPGGFSAVLFPVVADSTTAWFVGKQASTDNFLILKNGFTGSVAARSDAAFDISNSTGRLTFGYNPYVGSNVIWHAGNLTNVNQLANGSNYVTTGSSPTFANIYTTNGSVVDNSGTGNGLRINSPGGGSYATSSSTLTGAIKIRLPVFRTSTMMRMTVKIYEYAGGAAGTSRTIDIGGYNYGPGGWYNYFAYQSTHGGGDLNIRWGHDGSYNCIWIGETSSGWTYPQVYVTDVQLGYSGYTASNWIANWAITFDTSFGTVEAGPVTAARNWSTTSLTNLNQLSNGPGYITSSGSAAQLGGLTKSQLWNNSGQNHSTYTSFSGIPDFGMWYVRQDTGVTDGPGSAHQYYTMTQGLGNEYAYSSYAMMTAINRTGYGNPYMNIRFREGGSWGAWNKIYAGYADGITGGPTGDHNYTQTNISDSANDFNTWGTDRSRVGSIYGTANTPYGTAWYHIVNTRHRGGSGDGGSWGSQHAIGMTGYQNRTSYRTMSSGSWGSWIEYWTTSSLTNLNQLTNGPGYISGASPTFSGNIIINNSSPTLYFQDTDQLSAMLHNNSNIFYILRGGVNSTSWATVNGYWPLEVNLSTNDAVFGRHISTPVGYGNHGAGLIAGGVDNGSVIFYRTSNPFSLGNTDAVLTVSDRSNSDWGIRVDKAGADYGQYTQVANGATYAIAVNDGSTWTYRVNGNGDNFVRGNQVWHAGNLTSNTQLSNGSSYMTVPTGLQNVQNTQQAPGVGWYRIANLGTSQWSVRVIIQDGNSSGPHAVTSFIVSGAFNDRPGFSFHQLTGSSYAGMQVQYVRVLSASTYDQQYLEIYVPYIGSGGTWTISLLDARAASITWSGGTVPGGYTETRWTCGSSFSVGNGTGTQAYTTRGDNKLHVGAGGTSNPADAGIYFDNSSTGQYLHGNNDWGFRTTGSQGYIQFGPANTSWAHIYSNYNFYFNTNIWAGGNQVWTTGNLTNNNQLSNGSGYIANNSSGDYQIASSSNGGTAYYQASLELREANFGGSGYTPPRLGFHWGGVVASSIAIEASGRISIVNNPGTGYENLIASSIFASNFYNTNTAYGVIGTNGYFDTVNSGSNGDPIELVYYSNSSAVRIGQGTNGNQGLYAGALYDVGSRVLSQRGNSYYQVDTWLQSSGAHGLYFPSVSGQSAAPHWYANAGDGSYGAMVMNGYRNGYTGIVLTHGAANVLGMYDTGGNGGAWDPSTGWHFYWLRSSTCMGIGGSSTVGGYRARTNGSHYVDGTVYATSEVYAYSDVRKKKDIVTVDNALNKVLQLRGVYYKRTENPVMNSDDWNPNQQHLGVIAQEVDPIVPEVVTYNKEHDEYGVSYGNFAGLFIEAFKDMQKQFTDEINALKEEIKLLKGEA